MWMLDFFSWQFIDVITWKNPEEFLLVKKFDRPLDEIKDKSTLIVDPWYAAIFVHNGKIEAIQTTPWRWTLDTENVPFITSLKNILRWFESTDKAAIYFIKTIEITNQKWWTKNPVKYVDPIYQFPIKLRAFWNFSFKVSDIEHFWNNYVWTKSEVTVDEIRNLLVDRMLQFITDSFAELKLSYNDIDANRMEIAEKVLSKVNENIWDLWLKITDFRIEDTNFTEDTEELIAKIAEQTANVHNINQLQNVDQKALQNYKATKQLDIMEKAAENEWSTWSMMWTVVGMNLWNQVNQSSNNENNSSDIEIKLEKLKNLLDKWLITKEEYEEKKKELLKLL